MSWGLPHIEIITVWVICLIMWLIGIFFLTKGTRGWKLYRRMLFLFMTLVGLGLIISKPNHIIQLSPQVAHIFTSDYEEQQNGQENNTDGTKKTQPFSFGNVHSFLNSDASKLTNDVHIHGIGLSEDEVDLLKDYKLILHPSKTISGITNLSIPNITENESWILKGQFQGDDISSIFIVAPDDKTYIADLSDSTFQIRSLAPVAGSYILDIGVVLNEQDTLIEKLPIEVSHEPYWKMLVLSAYPSFENNYLKNYWTSLGNGFALRSKVSKEKYQTTFANATKTNLDVLNQKVLANYDFIFTDLLSWNQLGSNERRNIKRLVRDKGLALIIRPSETPMIATDLTLPSWSAPKDFEWKTSSSDVPLSLYDIKSTWKSVRRQSQVIAKYTSSGLGHIALLGIDETYKLILANEARSYQDIWANVFSNLYRDFSPTSKLSHNQWIWADQKTTIQILNNNHINSPPLLNNSISLPFVSPPFLTGVTEVTTWPQEGYNTIDFTESDDNIFQRLSFYAHSSDSWKSVKQKQLRIVNMHASERSLVKESTLNFKDEPISLYWWYVLVLLGFGGLWLDERVFGV